MQLLDKDRLINAICDSFYNVEKHNVKASKILLPYEAIHALSQSPFILVNNILTPKKSNDSFATLFGAKVFPVRNFKDAKVIGDDGFEHINSSILYYSNFNSLNIIVKSRAEFTSHFSSQEWTALYTLREMISEADFRKFLKFGFILVTGKSGHIYQIFRINHHVKVWDRGNLVKEVCVYLTDEKIPKTDKVIAFKTIIETDEESFLKMGNVYNMQKKAA